MKIDSHKVKQLRIAKNWSQEQLSEACGLSVRTIQRLENGDNASIESVRALSLAFDVDPSELLLNSHNQVMTPLGAIKKSLYQFTNFSGTATRFEYWWFFLFFLLVSAIAIVIHEKAYQIVTLILLLPFLAVGTRRLNDIERSGWWQLFFLVPFGQIVVLYLLAQANHSHSNLDIV